MTFRPFDHKNLGQLFMIGLPGLTLDDSTLRLIKDQRINNFILFRRNIADPGQLKELCYEIIRVCEVQALPRPLIAIDQEGGTVARLPLPFSQFDDARVLASSRYPEQELERYAHTCAAELLASGINMNLAPVLDVCPSGQGHVMARRCLSDDPEETGRLGCLVLTAMQNKGLAACAKHFPGLGSVHLDPHVDLPVVKLPEARLRAVDLVPFQRAISAGVAAIMTSHTIYTGLDEKTPATMSYIILTELLRKELGYQGLVITDDLEMGAIENLCPIDEAALRAFMAGADFLLICHDHNKVARAYRTLAEAYAEGRVTDERIAASLQRIEMVRSRFAVAGASL